MVKIIANRLSYAGCSLNMHMHTLTAIYNINNNSKMFLSRTASWKFLHLRGSWGGWDGEEECDASGFRWRSKKKKKRYYTSLYKIVMDSTQACLFSQAGGECS